MNNYYEQAMKKRVKKAKKLRELAHELYDKATQIINPTLTDLEEEQKLEEAQKLWAQHAELLSEVYPSPKPSHHIQATITDIYWRDDGSQGTIILQTSFATLAQFKEAQKELGWDYSLDSLQVGQCESCDEHYLERDGYKQGFCSISCLNEDKLLREYWEEYWKDEYAEHVVDSDPHDRDSC